MTLLTTVTVLIGFLVVLAIVLVVVLARAGRALAADEVRLRKEWFN